MLVENTTRRTVPADKATRAASFPARARGLMLKPPLAQGEGLIIQPCNSIHMFFMRYPLDVIFTDRAGRVLFMYRGIAPWRVGRIVKGAHTAIELACGTIERTGTQLGDVVTVSG